MDLFVGEFAVAVYAIDILWFYLLKILYYISVLLGILLVKKRKRKKNHPKDEEKTVLCKTTPACKIKKGAITDFPNFYHITAS